MPFCVGGVAAMFSSVVVRCMGYSRNRVPSVDNVPKEQIEGSATTPVWQASPS
jgi:hypothetical protein